MLTYDTFIKARILNWLGFIKKRGTITVKGKNWIRKHPHRELNYLGLLQRYGDEII